MTYIVWYWQAGQLHRVNCGQDSGWAWTMIKAFLDTTNYYPWLEYIDDYS